jgi:YidC/Oxa1 family membrane protein insertase
MDRKSVIVVVGCIALMALWSMVLVPKFLTPKPSPSGGTNTTTQIQGTNLTQPQPATAPALPPPSLSPAVAAKPAFTTNVPEQTLTLTNDDARYTFTSHGGGLKTVELVRYAETVSRRRKGQPLTNGVVKLNRDAPAPVLAVLGDDSVQGDGIFELTQTANGLRAEKTLTNGLRLVKDFQLSTNYLIHATVRLENTSASPLTLPPQEWVIGTATPMGPDDPGQNLGLMWHNGAKKEKILKPWFDNTSFLSCVGLASKQPRPEYRGGSNNVVWASAQNQFFALVAMPAEPALQIVSRSVELPRLDLDELPPNLKNAPPPKGFFTLLAYPGVTLAPGENLERQIHLFAGPKEYRTLARIADRFKNSVDAVMDFGWFGFFSKLLLVSMNGLHDLLNLGYGWVIIVITFIIKTLFWPLTAASTRSMKRMASLQPQMKALQEKYKDDPVKMNKKMMEFWKEHKVNPMGGCLPMILQMPVFIGFFYMIQSAIELRGESWMWVADLSRPDTLFYIPGIGFPFNLLPLLMGATMLWQSHLTPPSPGMDPMQQKMMRYMPLLFLFMLYNFSSGLTLYWTVQNLLSILQTKLTKTATPAAPTAPATSPVLTPRQKKKK